MIEPSNHPPAKPHLLYNQYMSDSPSTQNLQHLLIKSAIRTNHLHIIRRYRHCLSEIGKNAITQTIDGFLEYHDSIKSPQPLCQLQGEKACGININELRQEFQKTPGSRAYISNALRFSLMHDPTLVANISLPEDLETIDLLRRAAMKSDDFDKQRKNSKAVSDCAFNVLSMEGSFTTFHQDKLATFAVVSVGSKL